MSASLFHPHISNAVSPFPYNPMKIPAPFVSYRCSFIAFSISTNNGSSSAKVEGIRSEDSDKKSLESTSHSDSAVKAPTAPWMNETLLVKPSEILEFKKSRTKKDFANSGAQPDLDLTGKVGGGRGRLAMKQIFKGIEKLQGTHNLEEISKSPKNVVFKFAPGDLWGNGGYENEAEVEENSEEEPESLDSNEFGGIPFPEVETEGKLRKLPWERDEKMVITRVKKERVPTAAELSLDGMLLERLKTEAATITKWVKVKKAGVTQAVVDQIHFIWRNNELALIKFDIPLCQNMHRAREIVEMKTGGLVVWRNKDFLAVYRGSNYQSASKRFWNRHSDSTGNQENATGQREHLYQASLFERESDRLLDGLGPRFIDWWRQKPLPVDADMLPETVPGFKTPVRYCPSFTRSKLTDAELTYLRKLARPLPTHFVLGRNRKLQGLAAAILKLWEKCHIAKIAVKYGALNTDNKQMAFELKNLTRGVLLLRNKFLIILYRGKDFVPTEVAKVVAERELELTQNHLEEEAARLKGIETLSVTDEDFVNPGIMGTLSEFHSIHSESMNLTKEKTEADVQREAEQERLEKELKDQERKLSILKYKIEKSSRILEKLKNESRLSPQDPDFEIITEEERECLRKMGLKTESNLLLGRRGVYDGVLEGIHQHWKHKEIVKVITMQKNNSHVVGTAKCLEAESGGILISIVKLKEGHAIILYRGKNYKRPKSAAQNLLNKREALSRSLEIQRRGSLKFFASQKEQAIRDLKCKLAELSEKDN